MPDESTNHNKTISGYREGRKTAHGLKKQPTIKTPEQILSTYIEDKGTDWENAWKEGFWDGVRENTPFEDMRGGLDRD